MRFCFSALAAAVSFTLTSAISQAAPALPTGYGLVVEVKHHYHAHRKAPVGTQYWITTPNVGVSSSWPNYSYQSYGASPGQPGSPTYAPYAGLPPLRYYSN